MKPPWCQGAKPKRSTQRELLSGNGVKPYQLVRGVPFRPDATTRTATAAEPVTVTTRRRLPPLFGPFLPEPPLARFTLEEPLPTKLAIATLTTQRATHLHLVKPRKAITPPTGPGAEVRRL